MQRVHNQQNNEKKSELIKLRNLLNNFWFIKSKALGFILFFIRNDLNLKAPHIDRFQVKNPWNRIRNRAA